MKRGEVWWASLPDPIGSGPGYRRPVLIIQSDAFNRSGIGTIICAVISSNQKLAGAPGNVRLPKRASGLPKPSVVNVSQLISLDRKCLIKPVKELAPPTMSEVSEGLRLVMAL